MQQSDSNDYVSLTIGQCYLVNSFDLGFINITPTDLLVEVKIITRADNEIWLSVLPLPGQDISEDLFAIAKWFTESYPTLTAKNCPLKNLAAFESLINRGLATFHHTSSPATFPTLLTGIQRNLASPILPSGQPQDS